MEELKSDWATGSKHGDRSRLCAVSGESRSRVKNVETQSVGRAQTMHMREQGGRGRTSWCTLCVSRSIVIAWEVPFKIKRTFCYSRAYGHLSTCKHLLAWLSVLTKVVSHIIVPM